MEITIDTTNLCSHLQKKLSEPETVYYPILARFSRKCNSDVGNENAMDRGTIQTRSM